MRISSALTVGASAVMVMLAGCASAHEARGLEVEAIRDISTATVSVKEGVARVGWSRDDVPVQIDGTPFPPPAGLGSWAAFKPMPDGGAMVMGDTVVFEDEITPAMDAAFEHGLDVTALHNHFVFDRPPVYFMHIGGVGDEDELAASVEAMWNAIKDVRRAHPAPRSTFSSRAPDHRGGFDVRSLERILGAEASVNDGVVKFTFERRASMRGIEFGAPMGLATWAAFSGNPQEAVVDGDFAMRADEVQAVLRSLRRNGIHIVALHNHMIGEEPAYYFLHYWGKGQPEDLARGLHETLQAQESRRAGHP